MHYPFQHPMPASWLVGDLLALFLTLLVVVYIVRGSKRPIPLLLEGFAFVLLYASVFENFAVVQGWYVYGRSLVMIGDAPLAVPLIEFCVLTAGLWTFRKMRLPVWCGPIVVGLFGMLQDFTLDPVATQQIHAVQGVTSGRWTWLIGSNVVNIHAIPVYNFSGWMIIMAYAAAFILLGRWWYKRSGYKAWVGGVYPFLAILAALLVLVSPLSQFLLWLAPLGVKGSNSEWVALGSYFALSLIVLAGLWRGRMKRRLSWRGDLPVFAVVGLLHLVDIAAAVAGGHWTVLPLVLSVSFVEFALLAVIYACGRKAPKSSRGYE
jgi:hypothetical protein